MMRLFHGSKTLPWMAWLWTGFAVTSWMVDLAARSRSSRKCGRERCGRKRARNEPMLRRERNHGFERAGA
jgi:hypothetical protein